ncbi:MAG: hypothetical protein M0T79_09685 [Actinomycetota bacterium]|nr:hypothetical protein [Actinomycetota bacterium]
MTRQPTRRRDDRGSLTVFFMCICLALYVCIGLSVDDGRELAAHARTAFASSAAASAALAAPVPADALQYASISAASNGVTLLSLFPGPNGGYCTTTSITEKTWILGIVGIDHFTANTTACSMSAPKP